MFLPDLFQTTFEGMSDDEANRFIFNYYKNYSIQALNNLISETESNIDNLNKEIYELNNSLPKMKESAETSFFQELYKKYESSLVRKKNDLLNSERQLRDLNETKGKLENLKYNE